MKVLMRKIQSVENAEYYIIDFDFDAKNKARSKFYRKAEALLGKPVKNFALTASVIGVPDKEKAELIFAAAVKFGAKAACLRFAITLKTHSLEEASEATKSNMEANVK